MGDYFLRIPLSFFFSLFAKSHQHPSTFYYVEVDIHKSSIIVNTKMFSRCAFAVSFRAAVRCNKVKATHATITSAQYSSVSSNVAERTKRLLDAKAESGLSYDDLSNKLGLTNTYTAQLLLGQAKLKSDTAIKLQTNSTPQRYF